MRGTFFVFLYVYIYIFVASNSDTLGADGVGMQAHFDCGGVGLRKCPSPESMSRQIERFKELGLTVNISEMDVRIANLKLPSGASPQLITKIQHQVFDRCLRACWKHENFTGVWFWG